jgi:ATP-dependent DNA helicase RecG
VWAKQFTQSLPFRLTPSQDKVIGELAEDLSKTIPMNRLLQGDVGSGKTVIAAFALLLAAKNSRQGALLAPTEILAEQHFRTLLQVLKPFSISLELLTSSTPSSRRERLLAELKQGKLSLLVGTHALLQEDVRFNSLALAVIDEQHKFGVYQRCQLLNADPRPHQLVMTATPIPRTLALIIYGDLDTSTLRELPAGRQPISTYWITRAKQKEVLEHILKKVQAGEQAYFIFPLIEETEKSDLLAAKKEFENLRRTVFSDIKMGLVHGRLTKEERDTIMQAFRQGEIQVLVATSVVEVGVDHPNATVMVIENAERFGLSQLHQMRGRIGRGTKASECFLFGEPRSEEGKKRLRILTKTQDGFLIAQEDLKLRGPGDFLGTRQSGEPFFRIAHPVLDEDILLEARETAMVLLKNRTLEQNPEWDPMKKYFEQIQLRY